MFDKLVDIFVLGPTIMYKAKLLERLPANRLFGTAISIVQDLADVEKRLQNFYTELDQAQLERPLFWIQSTRQTIYEGDPCTDDAELIFSPSLGFPGLETGSILNWYCT